MSLKALLKKSRFTYRLALFLVRLPDPLLAGWMRLCHRLLGVDGNKVYFSCFNGALYNDNPRAVAEALHRMAPDVKLVFRLNRRGMAEPGVPDYITRVPRCSLRGLREMATAKVLVKNQYMKPWMRKFSDQFYIQTWHGDRGFKKVQLAAYPDRREFRREAEWIDLAVSGSDFGTWVFRNSFGVKGEILQEGCPRNDVLVRRSPEAAARARSELGIPEGAKALLYAPTFRNADTGSAQAAAFSLKKVRAVLEASTGARWVCLTRSHELCAGIDAEGAKDVTDYPDISALLLAVDLVITDYSSIGGDFMLLERPCIYFQPDRGDYDAERGLAFDPEDSPLLIAHDEPELLGMLSKPIDAAANCRAVLAHFGASETGHAAEAVARRILQALGRR